MDLQMDQELFQFGNNKTYPFILQKDHTSLALRMKYTFNYQIDYHRMSEWLRYPTVDRSARDRELACVNKCMHQSSLMKMTDAFASGY